MFGTRIKIMWDQQLVDPPIHYINKVPIIKNRDRSDYRFGTHKWIDLAGPDYLTDNDDISVIFFGPITSPKVTGDPYEIKTDPGWSAMIHDFC